MIYTIAEVSTLINLSKASIYNKIKLNEFKDHVSKRQGVTYLDETALNLIQSVSKDYKEDLNDIPVDYEIATDTDYINTLKEDINYLKNQLNEQLKQKDLQIEQKDNQISKLIDLNKNSQILLKDKPQQDILQLEEHFSVLDDKLEEVKNKMSDRKEQQEKRSLFSKMFRK